MIDPIGFMIISVPTGLVFFLGVIAFFGDMLPRITNKNDEGKTAGVV